MNIYDILERDDLDVRVTCKDRWLVWNGEQWVVYERKYRQKNTRTIYVGDSCEEAIKALVGEGKVE